MRDGPIDQRCFRVIRIGVPHLHAEFTSHFMQLGLEEQRRHLGGNAVRAESPWERDGAGVLLSLAVSVQASVRSAARMIAGVLAVWIINLWPPT